MIHLHIGRHKSGTSAIQHFLARNRVRLGKAGWEYPRALSGRVAHHDFAAGLDPARAADADEVTQRMRRREVERMRKWLAAPGDAEKIVSSEAFQNVDPALLSGVFPEGRTRVVVYLREPLDYLISSYAQAIQAQAARTPFVSYAAAFRPDYARFLDRWAAVFGHDAIHVRIYDRSLLAGGDILHDFADALGLPADQLRFPKAGANPSIGPELIEFKGVINAFVPEETQMALRLYARLSRLARPFPLRMRVPPAFAEAWRAQFAASNADVFARYLGRPGEGFKLKELTGEPLRIDPAQATARALKVMKSRSADTVKALRAMIPADLSGVEPLLPTDWEAATAAI